MKTAPIAEAIDILKYHCYRCSRRNECTLPTDWYLIWLKDEVDEMERKYQEELGNGVTHK